MNENQNIYVRPGRTTSRVLSDPGGTSHICIGGYTEADMERMRKLREEREAAKKNAAGVNMDIENKVKAATNERPRTESETVKDSASFVEKTTEKPVPTTSAALPMQRKTHISSNVFASSSTTNSFNVLTDRPTSRVSNPPGGRSNFTLG
mmetsp:Transcript_28960/g.78427  ORF Transcript_28960/g.78427 Transcript_28960/m.78427 type:complete len:150 (+) Transcript_28960:149-598(+)|eukprot:CAMPEP_0172374524 /NCGR_PEP_ID=MMETSP1060-20121228/56072_1 /TAXON_ID=37318 /ORGANISM="Pseudo-nitzschia pungens, Strain cf. cingulata" /LENGTH=149 /DNA_ID=CAMNT_0013101225 /DNA_START=94 /DNA_END=543 /DNA_ORIENTATION=+